MKTSDRATLALLGTVFLWSFMVVIARGLVAEVSPLTVLFYRLAIAALFFLPVFIRFRPWTKPRFPALALISLGSTVNLVFFILGIKYTSASASQVIYSAMPILILIIDRLLKGVSQPPKKIAGVIVGFLGLLFIVYLSGLEKGETITGSLTGNLLIVVAMTGWTTYLLTSKNYSRYFHPLEMGSTSIIVSFLVFGVIYLITGLFSPLSLSINMPTFFGVFYMGFAGTFLTYMLYQYAVHYSTPLKVSLTSYIQPVTTAFLAIIFLGERLTFYFILGSILVLTGVFLSSSVRFKFPFRQS